MTGELQHEISSLLPLRVDDYGIGDPFFNIYGTGWSLAINCNWSLVDDQDVIATWESEEADLESAVAALSGRSIVRLDLSDDLRDPVFTFDNGVELVVEADTDLDPWVLRVDGMSHVLVGAGPEEPPDQG